MESFVETDGAMDRSRQVPKLEDIVCRNAAMLIQSLKSNTTKLPA